MDFAPDDFVHIVEFSTPAPVSVNALRLFAVGDGPDYDNQREFASFTLKTKSPGSFDYDVTLLTYVPTHPYQILDPSTWALLDIELTEVSGQEFRAEFVQHNSSWGFNGPRIMELDGFASVPEIAPSIIVQPVSATVVHQSPVTFSVEARGGNLQYQWKLNGIAIPGATSSSLTIEKVNNAHRGDYTVDVSNSISSEQSAPATLKVILGKPL